MQLTKRQSWQAAQKYFTPNGDYMNLPQLGMFTPKEVHEGIENEHLVFSFENGLIYIGLGSEEDVSFRQMGRRRITVAGLNPSKALAWLDKIHPSVNREAVALGEIKTTKEDFDEWLGEPVKNDKVKFTPLKKILEQKELLQPD